MRAFRGTPWARLYLPPTVPQVGLLLGRVSPQTGQGADTRDLLTACLSCPETPVTREMPRLFLNSDLDRCVRGGGGGRRHTSLPCCLVRDEHCACAPRVFWSFPGLPDPATALLLSDLMPTLSCSFLVTPQGCLVTLACGVRLRFPAGATADPVNIHYRLRLPEPRLVPLGPHDALLSAVLELRPHGVAFQQARPGHSGRGQSRRARARVPVLTPAWPGRRWTCGCSLCPPGPGAAVRWWSGP